MRRKNIVTVITKSYSSSSHIKSSSDIFKIRLYYHDNIRRLWQASLLQGTKAYHQQEVWTRGLNPGLSAAQLGVTYK